MMMEKYCRVCGYPGKNLLKGNSPEEHELCPCCNVEHGYEDLVIDKVKEYRNKWISNGARFIEVSLKPESWKLEEQMTYIDGKWK